MRTRLALIPAIDAGIFSYRLILIRPVEEDVASLFRLLGISELRPNASKISQVKLTREVLDDKVHTLPWNLLKDTSQPILHYDKVRIWTVCLENM